MKQQKANVTRFTLKTKDQLSLKDSVVALHQSHKLQTAEMFRILDLKGRARTRSHAKQDKVVSEITWATSKAVFELLTNLVDRALCHSDWEYSHRAKHVTPPDLARRVLEVFGTLEKGVFEVWVYEHDSPILTIVYLEW